MLAIHKKDRCAFFEGWAAVVESGFTITTSNDRIRKLFEPYAPSIAARVRALNQLDSAGIKTYAMVASCSIDRGGKRMLKKSIILLLAFLFPVFAIFLMIHHAAQASTTYVGCKPIHLTVKTGQTFYLTVAVTNTVDLYAWQFDSDYSGTYLEFLYVFPGNYLRSDGTSHNFIAPINDITTTIAEQAAATRLQKHYRLDGNGEIAYVFFRAIKQNTTGTNVSLEGVKLVDRNAREITRDLYNSSKCKVIIRDDADGLIQPPVGELVYLPLIFR